MAESTDVQTITIAGRQYKLRYDDDTHRYFVNDVEYPSVTRILSYFGFSRGMEYVKNLDFYSNRGKAVHTCCEYDDAGELDEDSAAELMGYVDGWRLFKQHTGYEPSMTETIVVDIGRKFCGMIDRMCFIEDNKAKGEVTLLDIKHGVVTKSAQIQTAGYQLAVHSMRLYENPMKIYDNLRVNRIAVQLFNTGKYKVHRFDDQSDLYAFDHFSGAFNWMQKHGMVQQ